MFQIFKDGKQVNTVVADLQFVTEHYSKDGFSYVEVFSPDDIRVVRNALLAASDWTQVADAPVDQAAWAAYRQALRDITAQAGFPETIDWPVAPE